MTLEHRNEKILREILSVGNGIAAPADESENGPPISSAKLGERVAHLLLVVPRVSASKDYAPPGGGEPAALSIRNGTGVHRLAGYIYAIIRQA
jgi:hypothetical protein